MGPLTDPAGGAIDFEAAEWKTPMHRLGGGWRKGLGRQLAARLVRKVNDHCWTASQCHAVTVALICQTPFGPPPWEKKKNYTRRTLVDMCPMGF